MHRGHGCPSGATIDAATIVCPHRAKTAPVTRVAAAATSISGTSCARSSVQQVTVIVHNPWWSDLAPRAARCPPGAMYTSVQPRRADARHGCKTHQMMYSDSQDRHCSCARRVEQPNAWPHSRR
jgi:hypothetical protein